MNVMKEEILTGLGMALNEARVYLSLTETGLATATKIADHSGIHRVNVYDAVNKLKEKGLVGEVTHEGKKCYVAAPPTALQNILKEKEIQLNKIIHELNLCTQLSQKQDVQIYEGYDFIRNMFLHFLELKGNIYAFSVPKFVIDKVGKYFQEVIHKRRAEQKQMMYHIYSKEAIDRIKYLNTLPYTEAKYLEQEDYNVTNIICNDEVALCVFYNNEEKKPMIIMIKNKQVADAYINHFQVLWEKAKKP